MDSLTAAVALVIDNDRTELESVCDTLRHVASEYSDEDTAGGPLSKEDRSSLVRSYMADWLREKCSQFGTLSVFIPTPWLPFVEIAVSHMYTHTDWRALAQHYMQKVAEGC